MAEAFDLTTARSRLVARLKESGALRSPEVEAAFTAVPRHLFLSEVEPAEAYEDRAVVTKIAGGVTLSSSSQPSMMAIMLEQLQLRPGHRVLEIGAGTGFNAALMAHIVGAGSVVTLDLDEDIVERARRQLAQAGCERVIACRRDGGLGYAELAPFDRIILTVGAQQVAPSWLAQLKPTGRLVLPLALTPAVQLSVSFEPLGGGLRSLSVSPCDFIPMRGALSSARTATMLPLDASGDVRLQVQDTAGLDAARLWQALRAPGRIVASGLRLRPRELTAFDFWLRLETPGWCVLAAKGKWAQPGEMPALFGAAGSLCITGGLASAGGLCLLDLPASHEGGLLSAGSPASPADIVFRLYGDDEDLARQLLDLFARWQAAGAPGIDKLRIEVRPPRPPHPPGIAPAETPAEADQPGAGSQFVTRWD